jgi:hypothetical protein
MVHLSPTNVMDLERLCCRCMAPVGLLHPGNPFFQLWNSIYRLMPLTSGVVVRVAMAKSMPSSESSKMLCGGGTT